MGNGNRRNRGQNFGVRNSAQKVNLSTEEVMLCTKMQYFVPDKYFIMTKKALGSTIPGDHQSSLLF
jgi:hypothetical protein